MLRVISLATSFVVDALLDKVKTYVNANEIIGATRAVSAR